jgi:undecaprenyl diphosphate synthase
VSQLPPPEHVAIIMDGNSRWARERLLPRVMGHKAGIEAIRRVAEAADKRGIRVLTLYAFSTENWSRPRDEVEALMNLFSETIRREVDELAERGIELRFSGRLQDLSAPLQEQMRQANERTRVSGRAILNIAINYGGRQEIIDAIHELAREGANLAAWRVTCTLAGSPTRTWSSGRPARCDSATSCSGRRPTPSFTAPRRCGRISAEPTSTRR